MRVLLPLLLLLGCPRTPSPEAGGEADPATGRAASTAASPLPGADAPERTALARFNVQPFAHPVSEGPLATSPDGALLATAAGTRVHVFDAATGATLRVLELPEHVGALAFAGPQALAIGAGAQLFRADLAAASLVRLDETRHTGPLLALAAHGDALASSDADGNVHLWRGDAHVAALAEVEDTGDGVIVSEAVERLWLGPHGLLFPADWRGLAWYGLDGAFLRRVELPSPTDVGFTADGLRVLGPLGHKEYDRDPDVRLAVWRVGLDGEVHAEEPLVVGDPIDAAIAPDGRFVAAWDYERGLRGFPLDGDATEPLSLFPPDESVEDVHVGSGRVVVRSALRVNTVAREGWAPAVDTRQPVPGTLWALHLDEAGVAYLADRTHTYVWHTRKGEVAVWPVGGETLDVGEERVIGHDDTVWAADPDTGELLWELAGALGYSMANAVGLSADGAHAAYGGYDGKLVRVDTATGTRLDTIDVGAEIYDVALSPDGSAVAASFHGGFRVYDAEGELVRELELVADEFVAWTADALIFTAEEQLWRLPEAGEPVALGPASWHGASASADGSRLVWMDAKGGWLQVDQAPPVAVPGALVAMALSPDGSHLLVAHPDHSASLHRVEDLVAGRAAAAPLPDTSAPAQRPLPRPLASTEARSGPAFRGKRLASPGWTGDARVLLHPDARHVLAHAYDERDREVLRYGRIGEDRPAWEVVIEGYILAMAGDLALLETESETQAWIELGTGRTRLERTGPSPSRLAVSGDGRRVATDAGGGLTVHAAEGELLHRWETDGWPNHVQLSEDGRRVLWCDSRGAHLWTLDTGRVALLGGGGGGCTADPALESIYVADDYGQITRVTGKERLALDLGAEVWDLAWVEADVLVLAADLPYTPVVDLATGELLARLEGRAEDVAAHAGQIARAADGVAAWTWPELVPVNDAPRAQVEVIDGEQGRFAVGIGEGSVAVLERGAIVAHLWGFAGETTDLELRGERLAIGDRDGQAWVANWRTGEVEPRVHVGGGDVYVALSPGGDVLLASAAEEDEPSHLEIWDTTTWTRLHRSRHQRLSSFAFATHGQWFAAAGDRHSDVQIIHTRTGRVLRRKDLPYGHDWVYIGLVDDLVAVALSIGEEENYLTALPGEPEPIEAWGWAGAFSADGRRVAVSSEEEVLVLDALSGRVLQRIPAREVWALAWSGDQLGLAEHGRVPRAVPVRATGGPARGDALGPLAVAELDGVAAWEPVRAVQVGGRADSLAMSSAGEIAVLDAEGGLLVFGADGSERWRLGGWADFDTRIEHFAFAADGSLYASRRSGLSQRWSEGAEVDRREDCHHATWAEGEWTCGERYPRSRPSTEWDGVIRLDGEPLPAQPGRVRVSAVSADGRRALTGSDELGLVWDAKRREPVGVLPAPADDGVALLPTGEAVTLADGVLTWWAP